MTLKELSVDHPYYASGTNYYSNDAAGHFTTFADFYDEYANADVDMNLIYRWDITKREESDRYYAQFTIIHQRKGIYNPCHVDYIDETDVPNFITLVTKHWKVLNEIWRPISNL